jgi:hypothetical protein
MQEDDLIGFIKKMRPTEHVMLLYKGQDKYRVLCPYLKAGLDDGEAVAYVTCEPDLKNLRLTLQMSNVDVKRCEKEGALKIIDYRDWYMRNGEFNRERMVGLWRRLLDDSIDNGFKGLRVTGDMSFFFHNGMVDKLVNYETSLHRRLRIPLTAICAYDYDVFVKDNSAETAVALMRAHSHIIRTGPREALFKTA